MNACLSTYQSQTVDTNNRSRVHFGRETPIRTFPDIHGQIRTFPPDIWASGDLRLDSTITGFPFLSRDERLDSCRTGQASMRAATPEHCHGAHWLRHSGASHPLPMEPRLV